MTKAQVLRAIVLILLMCSAFVAGNRSRGPEVVQKHCATCEVCGAADPCNGFHQSSFTKIDECYELLYAEGPGAVRDCMAPIVKDLLAQELERLDQ